MKICKICKLASIKQSKSLEGGKTSIFNSYENIHTLHLIINSRKHSISKALQIFSSKKKDHERKHK